MSSLYKHCVIAIGVHSVIVLAVLFWCLATRPAEPAATFAIILIGDAPAYFMAPPGLHRGMLNWFDETVGSALFLGLFGGLQWSVVAAVIWGIRLIIAKLRQAPSPK